MYDPMIDVISKRRHFQRIIPPQKVNGQKELFAEISNALNQVPGYTSCLKGNSEISRFVAWLGLGPTNKPKMIPFKTLK